jgi:hypothetical protein
MTLSAGQESGQTRPVAAQSSVTAPARAHCVISVRTGTPAHQGDILVAQNRGKGAGMTRSWQQATARTAIAQLAKPNALFRLVPSLERGRLGSLLLEPPARRDADDKTLYTQGLTAGAQKAAIISACPPLALAFRGICNRCRAR